MFEWAGVSGYTPISTATTKTSGSGLFSWAGVPSYKRKKEGQYEWERLAEEQRLQEEREKIKAEQKKIRETEIATKTKALQSGSGFDWSTGQPVPTVKPAEQIKPASLFERLDVGAMNLTRGKPVLIDKPLKMKGYFLPDNVRQYPTSVDIIGQTGNYYFYRYVDQATGRTDVESVKKTDLVTKLTPEQQKLFEQGEQENKLLLQKEQQGIINEWNKKSGIEKVLSRTSSIAGSTLFGPGPVSEAGINKSELGTGNIVTDIATAVLGTIMGMATPVGPGTSLLNTGTSLAPAAMRAATGRAVAKTAPGAIARAGFETAAVNLPSSFYIAGTQQQNPQDMAKQIAIDTLAAMGLGAGFKGVATGISKIIDKNKISQMAGQSVDTLIANKRIITNAEPKKFETAKSFTVKNKPVVEAILGKSTEGTQASIKVPSLIEKKMLQEGTLKQPVKRSDIEKFISKTLEVPVAQGNFKQKAYGIFKVKPEVIRLKETKDLDTLFHETGHFLDKYYKFDKTSYKNELKTLGQVTSRSTYSEQQVIDEGVAEFMRKYIIDPAAAQKEAPKFFDHFEQIIKSNEDITKMIEAVKTATSNYVKQDPFARVLSNISIGEKKSKKPSFNKLYGQFVESDIAWEAATKKIAGKYYKQLQVSDNPYLQRVLMRGTKGKASAMMENGIRDANYNKISRGFEQIVEPFKADKVKMNEFKAFLVSDRAVTAAERNIKTGINLTDAKKVVEIGRNKGYDKIAKELVDFQSKLVDQTLVKSGIVSKEAADSWKVLWDNYVPFARVMEGFGEKGIASKVQAYDPVKGFLGSTRDIIDPFESIVKNAYLFTELAGRNDVNTALYRLSKRFHGAGKVVDEIPSPMKGTSFKIEELAAALEKAGIPKEEIKNADLDSIATIFRPRAPGMQDNTVTAYINGKTRYLQVFDEDLYRTIQGMDKESSNVFVNILSFPAKMLRAGATTTLDFAAKNPLRDAFTAMVYSKYGFLPGFDTMKGLFKAVKKGEEYYRWMYAGGANSELAAIDRQYLQGNLKEIMKTKKAKMAGYFINPLSGMQKISMLSEQATRLSEFAKGVGKETKAGAGVSEAYAKAALASRDVTLDFARSGTATKTYNRMTAFLNASIQGTDKMIRVFKENPVRSTYRAVASITIPSMMLYFLNRNNGYYQERPQWEKDLYWHIPIYPDGKYFLKVPKPFELGVMFGTSTERILRKLDQQDSTAFDKMGSTLADAFLPDFIPTGMKPIIENLTNFSFFQGRNIVPQSELNLEPSDQYNDYNSEMAKFIGKMLNVSPRKVDNLVQGYGGGLGKYFTSIIDIMTGKRIEYNEKNIPVVKSFISGGTGAESESIQNFYKLNEKEEAKYATDVKRGNVEKGNPPPYLQQLRSQKKDFTDMRNAITLIRNDDKINAANKQQRIKKIQEDMINIAREALGKNKLR